MKHNVHFYVTVRVVVEDVEADSQREAIDEAEKILLPKLNHGMLDSYSGHPTEYADEVIGYLVDEQGDEEYLQTRAYDQNKNPGKLSPTTGTPI